jgi:pimeloyl-ACP methyl ester carboxylesterase
MPLLDLALALWKVTPNKIAKLFFKGYAVFARWRHRHASETAAAIKEFVARRTPGDLAAMGHRLNLIRRTDPSVLARSIDVPVYSLAGTIDPIVCHWAVRKWLQRNCPGFRESRVIWPADHNVLSTTPDAAAAQVRQWMDFKDGTNSRLSPSNFPV